LSPGLFNWKKLHELERIHTNLREPIKRLQTLEAAV